MSESRRYSRSELLPRRRKTIADVIFKPFLKSARYSVKLSKSSHLYPKPHNRSFRHLDIYNYFQSIKSKEGKITENLDLNDFFNGNEVTHKSTDEQIEILERRKYPKGFSIYQAESFIDESKCFRAFKCFWKKDVTPLDDIGLVNSRRPSWLPRSRAMSAPRKATTHFQPANVNDPKYESNEVLKELVQGIIDNSNRYAVGIRMTRFLFGFQPTNQTRYNRPFFTIYVTLVQLVTFVVLICMFGIAPIGTGYKEIKDENIWIGPRQEDLIRVGARFTPCMKADPGHMRMFEKHLHDVSMMGCCIYNDDSGCLLTMQLHCPPLLATWLEDKICGLDPNYCEDPHRRLWSPNRTEWPICRKKLKEPMSPGNVVIDHHMQCQLMGRPCCIGVLGVCIITTREYCDFKRGAFYQEAYQCSQANCFAETCGLHPFVNPKVPDQFSRAFLSLFIIPGLFVMVVTFFFQMIIMYDLERLTGTFEMTIVYVLCGCCGNLFSGIFMPYYIELGPSGSQFGVLSILFVEIIRWNIQEQPHASFCIAIFVLLFLFMVGLIVPQVDNWAHACGLIYGSFISIAFRPVRRIVNRPISRFMIKFQRLIGIVFTILIPAVLIFFFYNVNMEFQCTACVHFNCISFTRDYCEGTSITLEYNNMMLTYEQ